MNEKQSLEVFSTMPIPQAIFKNAVPSIVAMLMVLIYNLADTFFIGQTHDPMQVAAIALASQIFVFYSALGTVFGIGGTSVISRALGAGNNEYAKKVSSFCMWGSITVGLFFSILMWLFMNPLLSLLGANQETWSFTKDYLMIVAASGPFVVINGCYSNVLRAEGQSTKAMLGQLWGNLTNVVLDPIFISLLHMNTKGAAIATVIGNLVGTGYYILYFCRGKSILSISIRDFSMKNKICSSVLGIGIPASLNTLFITISHIVLNKMMTGYGNLQLAGVGVATNLMKISGLVCIGFGQGIQPLVGYTFGAGNYARCKKIIRLSTAIGFVLSIVLCLLSYIFINPLVGAFLSDPDAFGYGVAFSKVMLSTSFLYGIFYLLTNVLQGFGEATASLIVNISRQGIIYIPALFIMRQLLGMDGLVWTQPVADVLAVILVIILFAITEIRLKKRVHSAGSPAQEEVYPIASCEKADCIITISRSFGAGGRSVGKGVAKALGIPYYDRNLLETAAKRSGISKNYLEQVDEKNISYGVGAGAAEPMEKLIYQAQTDAILAVAAHGPCVIVGRCADCILQKDHKIFRVFVSAPLDNRTRRVSERDGLSLSEATRKTKKVDKERSDYYKSFPGVKWGEPDCYELSVNTETLGIQGAVETVLSALKHFELEEVKEDANDPKRIETI